MARKTVALLAILLWQEAILSCPNCKETVADHSASLAEGYNLSILFMLGVVLSLGGLVFGLVAWLVRVEGSGGEENVQ